jgi:hypothetical protein
VLLCVGTHAAQEGLQVIPCTRLKNGASGAVTCRASNLVDSLLQPLLPAAAQPAQPRLK